MILHFININSIRLAIVILVSMSTLFGNNVFSAQKNRFYLPDKSGYIFWKCNREDCDIYLKIKNVNSVILLKNSLFPSVEALSEHLVRLFFSCGSPCNYTVFFDSKTGISQSFEFEVAVDIQHAVVVVAENNHLVGYRSLTKKKNLYLVLKEIGHPRQPCLVIFWKRSLSRMVFILNIWQGKILKKE